MTASRVPTTLVTGRSPRCAFGSEVGKRIDNRSISSVEERQPIKLWVAGSTPVCCSIGPDKAGASKLNAESSQVQVLNAHSGYVESWFKATVMLTSPEMGWASPVRGALRLVAAMRRRTISREMSAGETMGLLLLSRLEGINSGEESSHSGSRPTATSAGDRPMARRACPFTGWTRLSGTTVKSAGRLTHERQNCGDNILRYA